jgi:hypothetical protein
MKNQTPSTPGIYATRGVYTAQGLISEVAVTLDGKAWLANRSKSLFAIGFPNIVVFITDQFLRDEEGNPIPAPKNWEQRKIGKIGELQHIT